MKCGLRTVWLAILFLSLLAVHAYPSAQTTQADHRVSLPGQHYSSTAGLRASRKAALASIKPDPTTAAENEPLGLTASRGRHGVAKLPRRLTSVVNHAGIADSDEYVTYRVKRGDTLGELAERFGIDREELKDLNETARRRLVPGSIVLVPRAQEEPEEAPMVLNDPPLPWKNEDERGILVRVARSFTGAPYKLGGDTIRGLDCSGFVRKMYEIFGVQLPRSAREQFYAGSRVDKNDLTTGDLVFFKTKRFAQYPTHVGLYIGDGEFIHTSSFMRRGVRVDRLSDAYFKKTYAGAVTVKGPPTETTGAN